MSYKRSRTNYESDVPSYQQPPFALYGTPLPPLDSDSRDDGSYVPVWKQEVTDERGRKRLHGAFTGGFSAGYFNTVGSKEGWAPSTFVSSRSNRAKDGTAPAQKKAEDFMDEEDLADAAEAQKLETQGSFAGLGSTQEDGMRRGFMSDLFKTSGETMGVKLLQKMGWRSGQGVGPKVRRKARLDDGSIGSGKRDETHLFAPENSRMVSFNRKSNRFGLGWAGEDRLGGESTNRKSAGSRQDRDNDDDEYESESQKGIISFGRTAKLKSKPKRSGLGVGILNDTGSDEEDPYEMGPKISYNKIIGGDKKKKKGGIIANTVNLSSSKGVAPPSFTSRRLGQRNAGFRKCHDGLLPLDGFVLASMPLLNDQDNKHPPPTIPEGWVSSKSTETSADKSSFKSTADAARASTLDPASRAAVLGEQLLPGKSIFDYMSSTARDRLASATGRTNLPTAKGEAAPEGFAQTEAEKRKTLWDLVPRLERSVAAAALQRGTSGWMPYAEDAHKRARYRVFLEVISGVRTTLPERATPGTSLDDWSKEMREFAQAAEVFKPISGLMASRFTSSSSAPKVASDSDSASAPPTKPEDPAEAAAKFGMFGPMTRSRFPFHPTRLLCKRFNVKAPVHADPGTGPTTGAPGEGGGASSSSSSNSRLDVVSRAKLDQMMQEASRMRPPRAAPGGDPAAEVVVSEVLVKTSVVEPEVNEALEGERPGDAVFKAIFGSDSEDD